MSLMAYKRVRADMFVVFKMLNSKYDEKVSPKLLTSHNSRAQWCGCARARQGGAPVLLFFGKRARAQAGRCPGAPKQAFTCKIT